MARHSSPTRNITSGSARTRRRATRRLCGPGRPTMRWDSRSSLSYASEMHAIRKSVALVAILVGLASLRGAAQHQSPLISTSPTLPLLESYLESLRQQTGIPGMSGVLVRDRAVAWSRGFGYANVTSRITATPDTPYLVGDVSEIFGATLLLQCVEQRHLVLDDPISTLGLS